jgi:cytochrome c peroxidase
MDTPLVHDEEDTLFMRTPVLTLAAFAVITVGGGTYAARYVRADPSPAAERTPRLDGRTVVRLGDPRLLAGIPGAGPLELEEVRVWLNDPATNVPLMLELPAWLRPGAGQVKDLTDNPLTRGRIELGRQLFFDPRLSADSSVSCATCHELEHGFTVATRVAKGVAGQAGTRNPPALLNRIMLSVGDDRQFWDGRATSVEDALLHALADPTEMNAKPSAIVDRLSGIEGYRLQFECLYGDVSWDAIGDAIGAFVRCLVTGDSAYDAEVTWRSYRNLAQELLAEDTELAARRSEAREAAARNPFMESAHRGERLFFGNRAWCSACHNGVNFTDEGFHNIGVSLAASEPDLGRYRVTGRDEDWGAFKTPTIRGAVHTAPYMHDGSVDTLADVIDWYAHAGAANRNLDYRYRWIERTSLSRQDRDDLAAFVKACSGSLPTVEKSRLPR